MDMVCEKNRGVEHDFTKDPIKLVVEGNILRADGTTLGADNGVALAWMMALLTEQDLRLHRFRGSGPHRRPQPGV